MPTVDRVRDRARRNALRTLRLIGTELREARLAAGISQRHVATVAGLSQSRVCRTEQGTRLPIRVDELSAHAAALGLRVSVKFYPEGSPVRDAAQLRLLERLRPRVAPTFRWQAEALVAGRDDLRAWDVRLDGDGSVGIDAETRLHDIQALQRRFGAKQRDSGVDCAVLLVSDTRHNRRVLREQRQALSLSFPATPREVAAALGSGRLPDANGILII
jgi:transcriptional regulator with XRE-family HTH domain